MSALAVHFSSVEQRWATPRAVFAGLDAEFGFTVDACAAPDTACLPRYWTEADEGLMRSWDGERVFMNPPYGRQIARWMEKAWTEAPSAAVIVALVPSRTDSRWWHDYAMRADEIRFLRGRLAFGRPDRDVTKIDRAPFPSCILVYA